MSIEIRYRLMGTEDKLPQPSREFQREQLPVTQTHQMSMDELFVLFLRNRVLHKFLLISLPPSSFALYKVGELITQDRALGEINIFNQLALYSILTVVLFSLAVGCLTIRHSLQIKTALTKDSRRLPFKIHHLMKAYQDGVIDQEVIEEKLTRIERFFVGGLCSHDPELRVFCELFVRYL